jgi:glutamate-1-semialdehyde 2,1-aminomutase
MTSVWTVMYTQPSRYNWMLQFYLRDQGLLLSWVGTGRLIFNLATTDEDFERIASRFVAAARPCRPTAGGGRPPARATRASAAASCAN